MASQPLIPGLISLYRSSPGVSATPSSQQSQRSRYQSEMKALIGNELKKARVRDMFRQSGNYARCCVLCNQGRFFAVGIGFQHRKLEAYVFAFHQSGLASSRLLKLTTREGFDGLVRHIVGILSFKDEAAYGLDDPTRSQNMFCINNRYYEIDRLLHARGTLWDRSTTLYSLRGIYTCEF